jgi:hypothetical protein
MVTASSTTSASGVRVADDFRDNLIIDRYDPIFSLMRASKLKHLRSENSEDAVTWNVFRSLRQIEPAAWLPTLARAGLSNGVRIDPGGVVMNVWHSVAPPPALLSGGDEGVSEIDVVIESPRWVWFIEAKYRSDISTGTTTRPERDQVLRNIDVGSYYAGVREFFFSLLIRDEVHSPLGVDRVRQYAELTTARVLLEAHRPDGLANLKSVTHLTWADLGHVVQIARDGARRTHERGYAERAIGWMEEKGLLELC